MGNPLKSYRIEAGCGILLTVANDFQLCFWRKRKETLNMLLKVILLIFLTFLNQGCVIKDAYPIERISRGTGIIATAHVINDNKGTLVFGTVGKGIGWLTTAWSHVDVIALDKSGTFLEGVATNYFPSEVPNTYHGIIGRSYFSVRLPIAPPAGASIRVTIHYRPIAECEFNRR